MRKKRCKKSDESPKTQAARLQRLWDAHDAGNWEYQEPPTFGCILSKGHKGKCVLLPNLYSRDEAYNKLKRKGKADWGKAKLPMSARKQYARIIVCRRCKFSYMPDINYKHDAFLECKKKQIAIAAKDYTCSCFKKK